MEDREFDIDHILHLLKKLNEVNEKIAANEARMAQIRGDIEFWQLVVDEFYDAIEEEDEEEFE